MRARASSWLMALLLYQPLAVLLPPTPTSFRRDISRLIRNEKKESSVSEVLIADAFTRGFDAVESVSHQPYRPPALWMAVLSSDRLLKPIVDGCANAADICLCGSERGCRTYIYHRHLILYGVPCCLPMVCLGLAITEGSVDKDAAQFVLALIQDHACPILSVY